MRKNLYKHKIKLKNERVILSDVLPYEIPLSFSNKSFCKFLVENKVRCTDAGVFEWRKGAKYIDLVMKILSGDSQQYYVPFDFNIRHKTNDFRELTICHPISQLKIIDFYNRYKDLIIYYCNISPFSLRKPVRIARYSNYRDSSFYRKLSVTRSVEQYDEEYETLRSFFAYEKYNNIHKFYDSYEFHRCEKKFDNLLKLDISKCFDSIYTHTINWAILGKNEAKKHTKDRGVVSFSSKFDRLMQNLNHNETAGIIIGPEFSRIFAEIILQRIDKNVHFALSEKGIRNKVDYEAFRYVDDYFIFYNDEKNKDEIFELFQKELKGYRLSINTSKIEAYAKPIITDISIAKAKILDFLKILDKEKGVDNPIKTRKRIKSEKLISSTKIVLKESTVKYIDVANFLMSVIDRKVKTIINDFDLYKKKLQKDKLFDAQKDDLYSDLKKVLKEILDYVFYIYMMEPRVNSTVLLCFTIQRILLKIQAPSFPKQIRDVLKKIIADNIALCFKKNICNEFVQIETLYLLTILESFGKDYLLDQAVLKKYFGLDSTKTKITLNYLSITVLLFYIKNRRKYLSIRKILEMKICEYFGSLNEDNKNNAESIFLLIDIISCPYIEKNNKRMVLAKYLKKPDEINCLINNLSFSFTSWNSMNITKELDLKRNKSVY